MATRLAHIRTHPSILTFHLFPESCHQARQSSKALLGGRCPNVTSARKHYLRRALSDYHNLSPLRLAQSFAVSSKAFTRQCLWPWLADSHFLPSL